MQHLAAMESAWEAWRIGKPNANELHPALVKALQGVGYSEGTATAIATLHIIAFRHRSEESASRATWRKSMESSDATIAEAARDALAVADNPMRAMLLELIMNAPDPCGYDKVLPGYQGAWDKARAMLRATCTAHKVEGGTCDNCHGDTEGDE